MKWRWPWRREVNGSAQARAEAEAKLRSVQRMTPVYERLAKNLQDLPPEEFAERVIRAFGRRA